MDAPKVADSSVADWLDATYLKPHNSPLTGEMLVALCDTYNIPLLATLVVLGAESSLGDPDMGGPLARHNNFGCIKASVIGPWSETANGIITVRDEAWWTWPNAQTGLDAWGQYFADRFDGAYLDAVARSDWRGLAAVYYGRHVAGYAEYASSLEARAANIRAKAKKAGYEW